MSTRKVQPARPVDAQRAAVYEAENLVHRLVDRSAEFPTVTIAGSTLVVPVERRFGRVEDVRRYLDLVLDLPWVRQRWPQAGPVQVRARRGNTKAHYDTHSATIALPEHRGGTAWALRELVVLHELAHHLDRDGTGALHGSAFLTNLLDLLDGVVGAEAALLLRLTFHDLGVRLGGAA